MATKSKKSKSAPAPDAPAAPVRTAQTVGLYDEHRTGVTEVENADAGEFRIMVGGQTYERCATADDGLPLYAPFASR